MSQIGTNLLSPAGLNLQASSQGGYRLDVHFQACTWAQAKLSFFAFTHLLPWSSIYIQSPHPTRIILSGSGCPLNCPTLISNQASKQATQTGAARMLEIVGLLRGPGPSFPLNAPENYLRRGSGIGSVGVVEKGINVRTPRPRYFDQLK